MLPMPAKKAITLETLDAQIRQTQQALAALGPMRPGPLSRQYRRPQQRHGAYYQLSYTFQMRSRTEYVRPQEVAQLQAAQRPVGRLVAPAGQAPGQGGQGRQSCEPALKDCPSSNTEANVARSEAKNPAKPKVHRHLFRNIPATFAHKRPPSRARRSFPPGTI